MKYILPKAKQGFTLVELLVVIGILTVLLSIVLVAINPDKQLKQANDTKRRSDVLAILNAISQYAADNKGALPTAITTSSKTIANGATNADICADLTTTGNYIAQMPVDPTTGSWTDCTDYDTGYTVIKTSNGRVTVTATAEIAGQTISVTR